MKTHQASLAVVLAIGLAAPIAAQDPQREHEPGPAMSLHIQDDLDFVTMMHMHHQAGIEMSRIEVEHGQRDAVKKLALQIKNGQQRESEELEAFKERLGEQRSAAQDPTRMPRHRDDEAVQNMKQKMQAHMEKLRAASGPAADKMFVTMMARHHQQGVEMTQAVLPKLKDPDVRAFAQRTIENQKKEIGELKAVK